MNPEKREHSGKGTYILILVLDADKTIQVGRLGRIAFKKGWYAYVGSAFGPGGLVARIRHHIRPKKKCHWHLDYLDAQVTEAWVSDDGKQLEHSWAKELNKAASGYIRGFGCTDCKCDSHLFYFDSLRFLNKFRNKMRRQISIREVKGPKIVEGAL